MVGTSNQSVPEMVIEQMNRIVSNWDEYNLVY